MVLLVHHACHSLLEKPHDHYDDDDLKFNGLKLNNVLGRLNVTCVGPLSLLENDDNNVKLSTCYSDNQKCPKSCLGTYDFDPRLLKSQRRLKFQLIHIFTRLLFIVSCRYI